MLYNVQKFALEYLNEVLFAIFEIETFHAICRNSKSSTLCDFNIQINQLHVMTSCYMNVCKIFLFVQSPKVGWSTAFRFQMYKNESWQMPRASGGLLSKLAFICIPECSGCIAGIIFTSYRSDAQRIDSHNWWHELVTNVLLQPLDKKLPGKYATFGHLLTRSLFRYIFCLLLFIFVTKNVLFQCPYYIAHLNITPLLYF